MDSCDVWIPATNLGFTSLNEGVLGALGSVHLRSQLEKLEQVGGVLTRRAQGDNFVHGAAEVVDQARERGETEEGLKSGPGLSGSSRGTSRREFRTMYGHAHAFYAARS